MKRSRLVLIGCLATACATLTPSGARVRITTNPETIRGCEFVGEVVGKDRMWGGTGGQGVAQDNAEIRVKNQAAEMGANVVFLNTATTNTSGSRQRGEAYRCSKSQTAP